MPPPSNLSSSREPVVKKTISERLWWNSVAEKNPIGTNLCASANSFSTFTSENPLIALKEEENKCRWFQMSQLIEHSDEKNVKKIKIL